MTYAFVDTNLLLHFKVFEGINWTKLLNDKEVVLVICPTVLDEIDKYKDSAKGKVRNRAKSIYKILSNYLDGRKFNGIDLIFCDQGIIDPSTSTYSYGREDEYIIAAAKAFSCEGRKVIVSFDIGMKFRAKQADLDFKMPDDTTTNRLSQEPTEEEKRIKELEREILQYKNRRSNPILTFRNGETVIEIPQYLSPDFSQLIQKYKEDLIVDNPPYKYVRPALLHSISDAQVRSLICPYSDDEIEEYNGNITAYIDELVKLRYVKLNALVIDKHVTEIKFSIVNNGTEPTGKMGVEIVYPEGIIVVDENSFYDIDITPPNKPKLQTKQDKKLSQLTEQALAIHNYDYVNHRFYENDNKIYESHWHPDTSTVKSSFIELPSLNHNFEIPLKIPDRIFVFAREKGDFVIKWAISDESNIEPIVGELILKVK